MDAESKLYNSITQDQFYHCNINSQEGCKFINNIDGCLNEQLGNSITMGAAILSFISVVPMIVLLFLKHRNDRPRYGVILLFISDIIFSSICAPFLIAYAHGGDYRDTECIGPNKEQCVCGIGKHKILCGLRAFFAMIAFFSLFLNAMVIMYTIYLHLYLKQAHTEKFKLWKIALVTFGVPTVIATITVATGSFAPELPNYATICFTSSHTIIGKAARFIVFIIPYFVAWIFQIFVLVRIFTKKTQQNEDVEPLANDAEQGVKKDEMQKESNYFLLIYPITLLLFWIVNIIQRMSEVIDVPITNESFNNAGFILANCDGFVNSIVYGYFMWKDHSRHKHQSEKKEEQNSSLSETQKSQLKQRLSFEKFPD